jgi:hypothetical protein
MLKDVLNVAVELKLGQGMKEISLDSHPAHLKLEVAVEFKLGKGM